MLNEIFYSTSAQKVLYFLLSHPEERFYDREVSRLTRVGKAATKTCKTLCLIISNPTGSEIKVRTPKFPKVVRKTALNL